jgi:hypothetical protein
MIGRLPVDRNVKHASPIPTLVDPGIYGPEHGFRPDTKVQRFIVNFAFNAGGMGDYINYSGATTWLARNAPYIQGRLMVANYLVPLMQEIHKPYPEWQVFPGENAGQYMEPNCPLVGPEIQLEGRNVNPQLLNAVGAHIFDLGFAYYGSRCPAPPDAMLPMLDFPDSRLLPKVKRLQKKYVVVCTSSMVPSRWVSGKHLNPLIEHIKYLGLTPVFLGKKDVCSNGSLLSYNAEDISFHLGLDMREQTSVVDAAIIMQHAVATIGLDCGLLHLAAIMKDSNVIFAYNILRPEKRRPRRNWGKTIDVFLTDEELACSACQDKWPQFLTHTFHKCKYQDNLCIDLLFGNGAEKFRHALKEIMSNL